MVKELQEGDSKCCSQHDIILLSGWVSDVEVVRLDTDRFSCEVTVDTHGYTVGPNMKMTVAEVYRQHGSAPNDRPVCDSSEQTVASLLLKVL